GLLVGSLTGFLGVGGGSVGVPALIAALGMAMPTAVGTSLVIIALNSAVSLAARTGSNAFDWALILPFTLAAVLGSFGGRAVTDRLPARRSPRSSPSCSWRWPPMSSSRPPDGPHRRPPLGYP